MTEPRQLQMPPITSAVTPAESRALARLAEGQVVLEMGAHFGYSTVVLASVAEHVISVDWHAGDVHAGQSNSEPEFRANLWRYGVTDRVRVEVGRFEDVLPRLAAEGVVTDGAFIDAQHDSDSVRRDLALALRIVKPGGWIAFHDYGRGPHTGNPGFGVTEVADEFGVAGVAGCLCWGFVPPAGAGDEERQAADDLVQLSEELGLYDTGQ